MADQVKAVPKAVKQLKVQDLDSGPRYAGDFDGGAFHKVVINTPRVGTCNFCERLFFVGTFKQKLENSHKIKKLMGDEKHLTQIQ